MTNKDEDILIFTDPTGKRFYGSESLAKRLDRIERLLIAVYTLGLFYVVIKFSVIIRILKRIIEL